LESENLQLYYTQSSYNVMALWVWTVLLL